MPDKSPEKKLPVFLLARLHAGQRLQRCRLTHCYARGLPLTMLSLRGVGWDVQLDHCLLVGGSQETHEKMQETVIKFEEALEKRGKTLAQAEIQEVIDLLHEARQ